MTDTFLFSDPEEFTVTVENVSCTVQNHWSYIKKYPQQPIETNHSHSHPELFACCRGSVCLQTAEGPLSLHSGDIVIVPAGYPHRLDAPDKTDWFSFSFLCVHRRAGTLDLMRKLERVCFGSTPFFLQNDTALCASLAELNSRLEYGIYDQYNAGYLYALRFLELLLIIADKAIQPQAGHFISASGEMDRMSRLDSLVNEYYMTDFTAERAAELLRISTRQLSRIVRKRYGTSLRQVILKKRISAAQKMLLNTGKSPDTIGSEVGFGSRAAFYRAFREITGDSPAGYRKKHQIIHSDSGIAL